MYVFVVKLNTHILPSLKILIANLNQFFNGNLIVYIFLFHFKGIKIVFLIFKLIYYKSKDGKYGMFHLFCSKKHPKQKFYYAIILF